jgi:hypothetical protein
MFPHNKLGNQLIKEDCEGQTQIALSLKVHGGRDNLILSAKLIRIAPENSSF